jgi:hypothetical protein
MLSVAIPYSELVAYQCHSFRCGYDFIWRKRRVRLDFQKIVLTIPEFALCKDAKLAGLSPIDHLPKVRSVCHKVYFSLDARHTASASLRTACGSARSSWLVVAPPRHDRFCADHVGVCARNHHVVSLFPCMSSPASRSREAGLAACSLLAHIPSVGQEIDKMQSNSS